MKKVHHGYKRDDGSKVLINCRIDPQPPTTITSQATKDVTCLKCRKHSFFKYVKDVLEKT